MINTPICSREHWTPASAGATGTSSAGVTDTSSYRRRPVSSQEHWTPASAGVTYTFAGATYTSVGATRQHSGVTLLHSGPVTPAKAGVQIGFLLSLVFIAAISATPVVAQGAGGILDDLDADAAEPGALQAEAQLFETIRQGIALSIAECELTPKCTPTVNREELRRIVDKLGTRLDALTSRHSKSGDAALEPVMLAYVGTRDGYTEFLNKLDTILPPETDDSGTSVLDDVGELPPEFAIFADADADMSDDVDEPAAEAAPQQ